MDPAAMDFVMRRAPPSRSNRGGMSSMSLDHQHSPCPALRAAAEQNQLPGLHGHPHAANGTPYDPVHSSIGSGNWWHHNAHDGWQHPPYSPPHMLPRQIPMYTHAPPFPGPPGLVPPTGPSHTNVQQSPPFGIGGMMGDYYGTHVHAHAHAHPPPRFAQRSTVPGLDRMGGLPPNQSGQNNNYGGYTPGSDQSEQITQANRLPALAQITPNPLGAAPARDPSSPTSSSQSGGQSRTPERHRVARSSSVTVTMPPMPPRGAGSGPSHARASRNRNRLPVSTSDSPSDEDSGPDDIEMITTRMLDAIGADSIADGGLRSAQLLRGAISGKKVASRKAIASLESVEISELPEGEKTCIICYNDFGTETPEGINEAPLRLPKCQHVFGDHCIKKWFAESDSCPYCRDKLPSEEQRIHGSETVFHMMRQHHILTARGSTRLPIAGNEDAGWLENEGSSTTAGRRGDTLPSFRSWDRRSPPGDAAESRRRFRPRHGSLRGTPPSSRPNFFGAPLVPGVSHGQYFNSGSRFYSGGHNHRHSVGASGSPMPPRVNEGQSGFEHNVPPFPGNTALNQAHAPRLPYPNPLAFADTTHRNGWSYSRPEFYPPMSMHSDDPDVHMTDSDLTAAIAGVTYSSS